MSFTAFFISLFMQSCMHSDIFEKNTAIPSNQWKANYQPEYIFDISDTNATYTMDLTMRHTDAYPYANLWLNVKTFAPGEKQPITVKVEIPLAQPDGKWLGRGMNEIWEHRMPLTRNGESIRFPKKGAYKIRLEQIMRVNPLPEVMSVGIRITKNK
ncbi:hypothetical protein EMGBS15_02050 [Filimonas sp.]|nr:hypothetical protein EMGBS15_02050 [Filimonas sp.]